VLLEGKVVHGNTARRPRPTASSVTRPPIIDDNRKWLRGRWLGRRQGRNAPSEPRGGSTRYGREETLELTSSRPLQCYRLSREMPLRFDLGQLRLRRIAGCNALPIWRSLKRATFGHTALRSVFLISINRSDLFHKYLFQGA
jgi:hypothetical protein